jgi:Aerotolerance regulator N-terminal/von Willebrand factor type A domain
MVSFLYPLFLIGAVAAAVPIVLHLLKREPEARIRFSAVRLLRRAPVEHTRRRHLNELLLLLLRVAALLLLALAFARPFFSSGAASASATLTVVALDTSLSLSAPGQFDKAREGARAAIAGAGTDLVALVTFADSAVVAARPSADRGLVQSAVDTAAPGFGGTRYRGALNASADLFEGRSGALVVVTDVQASGWKTGDDVRLPAGVELEVADVGPPPPNFAVVGARTSGDRLIAAVRNAAGEARDARVRLTVDGRAAGEALVTVDAGQTAEAALPTVPGRDATITVDDPMGASGDNAWHMVLDAASRPAVLVVTTTGDLDRDAFYLRRAIGAAGRSGASYEVEGMATSRLSASDRAALDRYAAVVLLSTRGLESRGREAIAGYVQSGGGALVAIGPQLDPEVASGTFAGTLSIAPPEAGARDATRSLAPGDVRHPVIEPFAGRTAGLGLATFRRIGRIEVSACHLLARFSTGEPAIVDCAHGRGRLVAIASDLDNAWNDFPLHASFVPFIHEVVRYLGGSRPRRGDYLVADVPAGIPAVPGFASMTVAEAGTARVAVNVDPAESAAERLTPAEFEAPVTRVKQDAANRPGSGVHQQEERQHVWQYVLGLMVAMLVVESFVGSRTS